MGGVYRSLYSDTIDDFHTRPLIIKKGAFRVKSHNSQLNTVINRIRKILVHPSHPYYADTL